MQGKCSISWGICGIRSLGHS